MKGLKGPSSWNIVVAVAREVAIHLALTTLIYSHDKAHAHIFNWQQMTGSFYWIKQCDLQHNYVSSTAISKGILKINTLFGNFSLLHHVVQLLQSIDILCSILPSLMPLKQLNILPSSWCFILNVLFFFGLSFFCVRNNALTQKTKNPFGKSILKQLNNSIDAFPPSPHFQFPPFLSY